ncbi:MAG: DUF3883 domain-containing protein [Gaiellaceae bacterium MAG52_C11]|nr:DUF3883 domain-containing protein [Candidatus Gaiellasilicea maunaloa]
MIPPERHDLLDPALAILRDFGARTSIRGRFVALYLGLRRLGEDMPVLGSGSAIATGELEQHLDDLFTKTHRLEPFVVLTAPFGGSASPNAPYSTRTGVTAPGHSYATNTWRNNFGIQKGIGCPAEADVITELIQHPTMRLACPHMQQDTEGRHVCGITGTAYRGEEHAIWLRNLGGGVQRVDLRLRNLYEGYLRPVGSRIPIFPLIATLYCAARQDAYPHREVVGIPDFAEDFHFDLGEVGDLFDCDPDSTANGSLLSLLNEAVPPRGPMVGPDAEESVPVRPEPNPLPELAPAGQINSGVGAEIAVANELIANGWTVTYRGNQRGLGFDLEATRSGDTIHVEVKSSFGFAHPELLETEWAAAQQHADEFVLAVVDFYGSEQQSIWYVRDPAAAAVPVERVTTIFRLIRADIIPVSTEVDFL